jgi:hypothetical protein
MCCVCVVGFILIGDLTAFEKHLHVAKVLTRGL